MMIKAFCPVAKRGLISVGLLLLITSCGEPTVETSSIEALGRSLTSMKEDLEESDIELFNESLRYLVGGEVPTVSGVDPAHEALTLDIVRPLAGRNADGVVAEAFLRRKREVRDAIEELEEIRASAAKAPDTLRGLRLSGIKVFKRHREFLEWPVFEMKAENTTDQLVYLVHMRAAVLKEGEPDPWLVEEMNHVVMRGFGPSARDLWRIEPDQQEWIQLIGDLPGVALVVEVMRLEGRGGVVLASRAWGAVEKHRLDLYKSTLQVIRENQTLALELPPLAQIEEAEAADLEDSNADEDSE
ncbi:MAG: hypothetical protein GY906_20100 [bacterium]|nr:hypothetical protein [bacterium]